MVKEIIQRSDIESIDKLRLTILFSLRYGGDDKVTELIRELEQENAKQGDIVRMVMKYAGKDKRKLGSGEGGFVGKFTKVFKEAFKGIPNVFTQHKSVMYGIVESVIKGTLNDLDYPSPDVGISNQRMGDIIVFIVGGATYQESREVNDFNKQGYNLLLGGSNIHNSKSFLGDIMFFNEQFAMGMDRNEEFKSF